MTSAILRYLAVAHFGRGRGNYVEGEAPAFWQAEVERSLQASPQQIEQRWKAVRAAATLDEAVALVEAVLAPAIEQVFAQLYPGLGASDRFLHVENTEVSMLKQNEG